MRAVAWTYSFVRVPCRFRAFVTRTLGEGKNEDAVTNARYIPTKDKQSHTLT